MDRSLLAELLEEGLSLAAIGRRTGRHPTTVAYWLRKHGLQANGTAKHAAKRAVTREELADLIERGLSVRELAAALGRSPASVRHWLRRHGFETQKALTRGPRARKPVTIERVCRRHGRTTFTRVGRQRQYRCRRCVSAGVAAHRRQVKRVLVEEAGGRCQRCGYDRYIGALEFHHRDPAEKSFALGGGGLTRSLDTLRKEAAKCVLLCATCHAEVTAAIVDYPSETRDGHLSRSDDPG